MKLYTQTHDMFLCCTLCDPPIGALRRNDEERDGDESDDSEEIELPHWQHED